MASVFPYTNGTATTDAFSDPLSTSPLNSPSHSALHTDVNTAVETIETILQSGGGSRNLLYNGAMQVAQRGTSTASITASGYYTADRWLFAVSSAGTWTESVENDAPTGSGFRKSTKLLCTTADASLAAGDLALFLQILEGQDLQALRKGTSQTQPVTVSFWVKSNVTGTYILDIFDSTNTRGISRSYTVSSAGAWEFKTITFPGDTVGTLNNDNAGSLNFRWWLAAGSSYQSGTLQTSWAASSSSVAVGQVNVASATNNYWQVTGVQLNVGSVAAPFEFKPYGQELRECQRYYERASGGAGSGIMPGFFITADLTSTAYRYIVPKRSSPTFTVSNFSNLRVIYGGGGVANITGLNGATISADAIYFQFSHANFATIGQGNVVQFQANGWIEFGAEL